MRANELPAERELVEGVKPKAGHRLSPEFTRELAIRTTELMSSQSLLERDLMIRMKLGSGTYRLPHFPVRDVKVNGHELQSYEVDEGKGILYVQFPETEHTITYRTGFEPSMIPAVYRELVLRLGRYIYGGDEEEKLESTNLLKTVRRIRASVERERDGIQVDGEIEGKGPPGYR